jgi:hypothetical protein
MAVMRISALLAVLFCEVIGSTRPGDAAAVLSEAVRVCVQKTPLSSSVAAKNVGDERQTSSNDNRFWRYPD